MCWWNARPDIFDMSLHLGGSLSCVRTGHTSRIDMELEEVECYRRLGSVYCVRRPLPSSTFQMIHGVGLFVARDVMRLQYLCSILLERRCWLMVSSSISCSTVAITAAMVAAVDGFERVIFG